MCSPYTALQYSVSVINVRQKFLRSIHNQMDFECISDILIIPLWNSVRIHANANSMQIRNTKSYRTPSFSSECCQSAWSIWKMRFYILKFWWGLVFPRKLRFSCTHDEMWWIYSSIRPCFPKNWLSLFVEFVFEFLTRPKISALE